MTRRWLGLTTTTALLSGREALGLSMLVLSACAKPASAPPPAPPAVSALQACNDLPAQPDAVAADEHVTKFELRGADVDVSGACFNSGGHRVVAQKGSGVLVFPLHIKKSALSGVVKYHLHVKDGSASLTYDNEIRPSKHADDVVKLTVSKKDGQLEATQAR